MKPVTLQIIVQMINVEELKQFYNFQKKFEGKLFISKPISIEQWRKQ